jgi:MFS family permease
MLTICFALASTGLSMMTIGLAPSNGYLIALGAIFATGAFVSIVNAALMAVMQSVIPAAMQGRVFSLISSSVLAMTPLGLAIGGPTADWLGPQIWYVIAGLVCAMIGVTMVFIPTAMNLDKSAPIKPATPEKIPE